MKLGNAITSLAAIGIAFSWLPTSANSGPASDKSIIGFQTIDAARSSILSDARFSTTAAPGWILARNAKSNVTWYFSTPDNAAHPAAVTRMLHVQKAGLAKGMGVACHGVAEACKALRQAFFAQLDQIDISQANDLILPPSTLSMATAIAQSPSLTNAAAGSQRSPPVGLPIGYSAIIRIRLPVGADGVRCSEGGGVCTSRFAKWTALPDQAQATKILAIAGRVEGVTETTCQVGPNGNLLGCRSQGVIDENVTAAIDSAVALMRVPETMLGRPTEASVVSISWDWSELRQGVWLNPGPIELASH
jgi:hypothetical protein